MMKKILLFVSLFISLGVLAQIEKQLPDAPVPMRYVVDQTGTLTSDQLSALEQKLHTYEDSTSSQFEVVIIPSTNDYDIAEFATALGRKWGVGQKGKNNGLIFLIAKDDRKMFIAPGYGLEGAIPDITAKQIIDNVVLPNFKGNDFYGGIDQGIDALILAAKGEFVAEEHHARNQDEPSWQLIVVMVVFFLILAIFGKKGRRGGVYIGGSSSSWSSSSDSGSSFGGGSFGGGGAGGSW